ncbi:gamma-glutamyltransferase [Streptomyces sp. NPDC057456]|uniref:gamma-glutamyltransferase n=1 Tax=Streptomyces sp. NPDC057456 TaxID=3346139 RepID=UPI00369FB0F3
MGRSPDEATEAPDGDPRSSGLLDSHEVSRAKLIHREVRPGSLGLPLRPQTAAREGVPVAPGLAQDLRRERDNLALDPGMRGVFFADGDVLAAMRTLRQPRLVHTLTMIADQGLRAVYGGEVGASLVKLLAERGSSMPEEDFAEHAVLLSRPHSASYDRVEYLSSGGNSQSQY